MKELELLDVHPDKTQLVLTDSEGERYTLPITDRLRDVLRPQRSTLASVKTRIGSGAPSVRDIQAMIRMGTTAADIARQFDLPVDNVARYEKPILDERSFAAKRARSCRIGSQSDAPLLGDLVVDRLAARGIDAATVSWDAVRKGNEPWEIIVRFVQSATEKEARWSIDSSFSDVTALDGEARWLTETAKTPHSDPFGLEPEPWEQNTDEAPVRPTFPSMEAESLISEVNSRRGIRQDLDMTEFDEFDDEDEAPAEEDANAEDIQPAGDVVPLSALANRSSDEDEESDSLGSTDAIMTVISNEDAPTDAPPRNSDKDNRQTSQASDAPAGDASAADPSAGDGPDTLPGMETMGTMTRQPVSSSHSKGKKRRSVPHFDEIFFGPRK